MASATSLTILEDEVNCPICQGTLREPVTIDCGHNFCRGCLARYCEIPGSDPGEQPICPLCKDPFHPEGLRPNWQLASVVENIEKLKLAPSPGLGEDLCEEHEEKIYFFCEDDEKQLCVKCREALEHRTHTVRFLEDAADPYREQIHRCLESLKNEREDIQGIQSREDQRIQVLLTQVATKREKVMSEFEHMCQFLEKQQYSLLTQLEELDGDILKQKNEFETLVQSEICRFNALISELEEKLERPAGELLKDIRSTLIRCETRKCRKPEAVSPDLGERIRDFPQQALQLQREMKMFLEKLLFELDYEPGCFEFGIRLRRPAKTNEQEVITTTNNPAAVTMKKTYLTQVMGKTVQTGVLKTAKKQPEVGLASSTFSLKVGSQKCLKQLEA